MDMIETVRPSRHRYRVAHIAGRPLITTPDRPLRLRLAGLAQYRPVTKKRAFLRALLRWGAITGADWLFTRTRPMPVPGSDGFDFERMLEEIRDTLGVASSVATVIWP